MDKLKLIERAEYCSIQLLEGKDPATGMTIDEDSILNTDKMKNYFLFVSKILEEIRLNDGLVALPTNSNREVVSKKEPFTLSSKGKEAIRLSNTPIKPSVFVYRINNAINKAKMERFSVSNLNKWFLSKGLLTSHKEIATINKTVYDLTDQSREFGFIEDTVTNSQTGEVSKVVLLSEVAQKKILDNIEEISRFTPNEQKTSQKEHFSN